LAPKWIKSAKNRESIVLAEALSKTPDGFEKRYRKKTRNLRRNFSFKILKSHFIFNPNLRKMVMRSGLQSVKLFRAQERN
jgi:hypothetical protein